MTMNMGYGDVELVKKIIDLKMGSDKKSFTFNEIMTIFTEMKNEYQYYKIKRHGISHRAYRKFIDMLLYEVIANKDIFILLTGGKGVGKSSFALALAKEWCRLIGWQFDPNKYIAYTNEQAMEKIESLPPFSPLILDEGINFCSSENWSKSENKDLKKRLGQVRTKHLFYIMCFPLKVRKVDKVYLESYVNYWIEVFDRGKGALFIKNINPEMDSWSLGSFKDLGSYTNFTSPEVIRDKLKRHPNFWKIVTVPKPSETLYTKYLEVRERNIYHSTDVMASITKMDIYRALLIKTLKDIMIRDSNVTLKRLALHIKEHYHVDINTKQISFILDDSEKMVKNVKALKC